MTPRKKLICSACNDNQALLQRNTLRLVSAQSELIKAKKMLKDIQTELVLLKDVQAQLQTLKKMKWQEVILNLIECAEFQLSNANVNYHR